MNTYQPFGGQQSLINPWLNMASVSQTVPNVNANPNWGLPLGTPLLPTHNMNERLPVVPMNEPLPYFGDKFELKPPSAYEHPLQIPDHQQETPVHHEQHVQLTQFRNQAQYQQGFSEQQVYQQLFSHQAEYQQGFSEQQVHQQLFSDQPEHQQHFSGPLYRKWQPPKPKYNKRVEFTFEQNRSFSCFRETPINKDWTKGKALREKKQKRTSSKCETIFEQTDTDTSWTTRKFVAITNNRIEMDKKLSNSEMEFINRDSVDNNIGEIDNDASSDEIDDESCRNKNRIENCDNENRIESDELDDDDEGQGAREKLDDIERQGARVTFGRMLIRPNNVRITVQGGTRTSEKINVGKQQNTFFCYICNVCCTSKEVFDSHNETASHLSKMDAVEATNEIKTKRLLERVENRTSQLQLEPKKGKFCTLCQVRVIGSNLEHKKSKEHRQFKIANKPNCAFCDLRFKSPKAFVKHLKTQNHLHNKLLRSKLETAKSLEENAVEPREVPIAAVETVPVAAVETVPVAAVETAPSNDATEVLNMIEEDGDTSKWTGNEVGKWLLVPIRGLYCKGCKKYYEDKTRAANHCRSAAHYKKYKEYVEKVQKKQEK